MSFEQIVTYIIAPLATAAAAIWGLVKWVIPKFVDAKLTEQKDVREHRQRMDALQTEYLKAEAETTYQMMGSLLENSQAKEDKANEFFRTLYFNAVDQIKTNVAHIPDLKKDVGTVKHQIANLETKLSIIIELFQDEDHHKPPTKPAETGRDDE